MSLELKESLVDYDPETGRMNSPPRQVFLELSSRCNLACVHCPKDFGADLDHPKLDMPLEVIRAVGPWLESATFVNLNGIGESLLSPHFDDVLDICRTAECELSFNTNGLLLSEHRCARLVECGVQSVGVSIDGLESNLSIRGVEYSTVRSRLSSLDAAKRAAGSEKPNVSVAFTLMRRNMFELPKLLRDLLPRVRLHSVQVQPLVVFYETLRDENPYRAPMIEDAIEEAREVAEQFATPLILFRSSSREDERNRDAGRGQLGQASTKYGCIDPFYEVKVRSTGDVMSCAYGLMAGARVTEQPLDAIWNNDWYRSLRRRLAAKEFEGPCGTCPYVRGSAEHQEDPLRQGVHHSQEARFFRGGYGRRRPPTVAPDVRFLSDE